MGNISRPPKLALALNTVSSDVAKRWIMMLQEGVDIIKFGLPLLMREGPSLLGEIKKLKKEIFLDLKLHDIPSVVEDAVKAAQYLDVDYITLHTTGGFKMLSDAVKAKKSEKPYLLGVTVLSSLSNDELKELGFSERNKLSINLTELAVKAGLDGVVASGEEVGDIRKEFPDILIACPGIRLAGGAIEDQKVHLTPYYALKLGADILVVGRPITNAKDPKRALDLIRKEMNKSQIQR